MLVYRRVTPSIKFTGTHLHTWVERGTVRVKCLAQEQNAMFPARVRSQTVRCGDERSNHEATASPDKEVRWNITQENSSLNLNRVCLTMLISGQSMPILEISSPTTRYSCVRWFVSSVSSSYKERYQVLTVSIMSFS